MHPLLSSTIVFANDNWLWLVIAFAVGALAFLWVGYARSPLRGGVRWLAMGLKFAGLLLLALCLMEPTLVDESPKKGANDLAIVADNSRGMAVKGPGSGGKTAGEEMAELIGGESGELPGWMADLDDMFRLQTYTFDSRLKRSGDFTDLDFKGDSSTLITAVGSLRTRYEKRPLVGMFVFSDGNATDADGLDGLLADLKKKGAGSEKPVPVFPVIIGSDLDGGKDLGIQSINVAQSPFEDAPVTMSIGVRSFGEFDGEAAIIVTDDTGKEMARDTVAIARNGTSQKRVEIKGVVPGVSFFKVAVYEKSVAELMSKPDELAAKAKELTLENNSRLVAVDRGKGPYRVLYVSGRPNWEFKFLRRAVRADPEIDLVALIRIAKREPKFEWRGREGEMSNPLFRGFDSDIPEEAQEYDEPVLIRINTRDEEELRDGFPKTDEELFSNYRAIILDDVESEFFTVEQQNLLDRFVSTRGGTVVMLGGQESFQQGKWNNTPVGRLLPVYLDRISRGSPALDSTFNLTREGWLEPWVRLRASQDEEETRLAYMPTFQVVNKIQAIKPGSSVFAMAADSDQRQHPLLATQRYGEGQSAALMVGDMWRWGMKDEEQQLDLAKTWRQLIRWSVVDVNDRIQMSLLRDSDGAVASIDLETRVVTDAFLPQDDASVKFEITGPESDPTEMFGEPSLVEAGLFNAEFYPSKAGGYRVKATVRDSQGDLIGEKESGWALNPAADEFKSLVPNRTLMEAIAEASGGKVLTLAEVPEFMKTLPELKAPITEKITRPLWHMPWIFLLALACFAGEWALRRWKGVL